MAEKREDVFQARLDKALNFLSERGFSRKLRQEQRCSVRQLFSRGDLLAVLPTGFKKSLIFQVLALMKEDCVILVICPLKLILRTTFTWRPPSGRLSMFKNWSRLSLFSFSDI